LFSATINKHGDVMKRTGINLIFLSILIAAFIGCDSQSGVNDANLGKSSGNIGGNQINQNGNLPEFLTYSVIGGEEVTLNGSPIFVDESDDPDLNANIHSNNTVKLNGKRIGVDGFVTYVDNIIIDGDNITITPNSNPTNLPPHYQVSGVNIYSIEVEDYKSIADVVYDTDKQLSGLITLGTQSDPYIIYVTGNLYLDAVTFDGYGILLAEKEVDIVSNTINSSPDPLHSKVLIVAGDKFIFNNSSSIMEASVYARNEININSNDGTIEGNLATLRKNTLNGNGINFYYKPVYQGLSDIIFGTNKN
jgi:hypothetical protein